MIYPFSTHAQTSGNTIITSFHGTARQNADRSRLCFELKSGYQLFSVLLTDYPETAYTREPFALFGEQGGA